MNITTFRLHKWLYQRSVFILLYIEEYTKNTKTEMNLIQSAGFLPFQLAKGLESRAKTLVFGEEPTVARVNTVNNRDKILSFSVKTFDELRARVEEELACDGVRLFHCNG